jgi:phosphoribosylformylglycinamidine synthase
MKSAVLVFPGSNRERDMARALKLASGNETAMVWHAETSLPKGTDLVVVPGGFSSGDYLRCGAIAARAPVMDAVRAFAAKGGLVLGVCNGFQILCESGLLPGALMRNAGLKYVCKPVHVRLETNNTPYTNALAKGEVLQIPVGHMEGNYVCDERTLAELKDQDRIVFRYVTRQGEVTADANPNGSLENIAGICNEGRNVLGMMPHPERAAEPELGMTDGVKIFHSLVGSMAAR